MYIDVFSVPRVIMFLLEFRPFLVYIYSDVPVDVFKTLNVNY